MRRNLWIEGGNRSPAVFSSAGGDCRRRIMNSDRRESMYWSVAAAEEILSWASAEPDCCRERRSSSRSDR